jgi:hypothetical protein
MRHTRVGIYMEVKIRNFNIGLFIEICSGVFSQVMRKRNLRKFVTLPTASVVLLEGAYVCKPADTSDVWLLKLSD